MTKQLVCSSCGYIGDTKKAVRGSLGVEIFLWLCLLVPGFIYSMWRQSTYHKVCPSCGSTNLIPVDSPNGKRILEQQGKTLDQVKEENKLESKWSTSKKIYVVIGIVFLLSMLQSIISLYFSF